MISYWAMRRVMQRANEVLGTNRTLHDLRHTAASHMANGGTLTLVEVQGIMRHANIQTTSRYLTARVEEIFDEWWPSGERAGNWPTPPGGAGGRKPVPVLEVCTPMRYRSNGRPQLRATSEGGHGGGTLSEDTVPDTSE
ncbi:hypothetical protein ADK41_30750 [Streptomyces caelestis]|uniref:Tyr recombinase domain-containing protein n=1 Tax=Streptomyces caelestis TaxID=36816 RepID=A0A0M8QH76_9ACTN|nr:MULTISPECIES: site-specific integrase [Streptomyces]KOT31775.1 hypothetical protein ADK41_30750 [Streptomyces caelestis]